MRNVPLGTFRVRFPQRSSRSGSGRSTGHEPACAPASGNLFVRNDTSCSKNALLKNARPGKAPSVPKKTRTRRYRAAELPAAANALPGPTTAPRLKQDNRPKANRPAAANRTVEAAGLNPDSPAADLRRPLLRTPPSLSQQPIAFSEQTLPHPPRHGTRTGRSRDRTGSRQPPAKKSVSARLQPGKNASGGTASSRSARSFRKPFCLRAYSCDEADPPSELTAGAVVGAAFAPRRCRRPPRWRRLRLREPPFSELPVAEAFSAAAGAGL